MLSSIDLRSPDIFERLSSEQLIDFTSNITPNFTLLERFFPTTHTAAEVIRISDFDIDFNPTALAVAENTIAPVLQRPDYEQGFQDLVTFKSEYRLTDSQVRVVESAATSEEKQKALQYVLNDYGRCKVSQYIARERLRAQALFTGALEIKENGFSGKVDFQLDPSHKVEVDLAQDDIIAKLHEFNQTNRKDTHKTLARWVLQEDDLFKLMGNESLRMAALGKEEAKSRTYLLEEEVRRAIKGFAGIELDIIRDPVSGDYHYTENLYDPAANGAAEVPFIPEKTSVLLPNINLGLTIVGQTAEGMEIAKNPEVSAVTTDGITIFSNYEKRPLNYVTTSVQRFTVIYPKCPCTMIVTDTGE